MTDETPQVLVTGTGISSATNDIVIAESSSGRADPIIAELSGLTSKLVDVIQRQNSAPLVLNLLKDLHSADAVTQAPREWELAGLYYLHRGRFTESLGIFLALYELLSKAQESRGWIHKGLPLCWICDALFALGYVVHAKRYLMLTMCEDAIRERGVITPALGGIYWRAVWRHGLNDYQFHKIARRFYELAVEHKEIEQFPEALLQELDIEWRTEIPSPGESGTYILNSVYLSWLMNKLGDRTGSSLEHLAQYLMDCMPGCRTIRRVRTPSTDHDLVCSIEGFEVDFRAEFGRYFLCECKDWSSTADFSTIAKFCRVLDSVKARFGILFSRHGASGAGQGTYSDREILKYFQDSGKVIVVVDQGEIDEVLKGSNFIALLRAKYESVRLDISKKRHD
jgi:hypothetical protein